MRSIRASLSFLIAGTALLILLAAAGILLAMHTSDQAVERLTLSQRRLDLLAEISGQLTDYAFAAVDSAQAPSPSRQHLTALHAQITAVMDSADALEDAQTPQSPRRVLAQLRSDFETLDSVVAGAMAQGDAGTRADTIRGALNGFALTAGPNLSSLVETERQAVQRDREDIARTSGRLTWAAVIAAALAITIALLLHRTITGPLLRRIGAIDSAARAIGRGRLDTRLDVGARDELGLLVARFNRMAASLARREGKLSEDRASLGRAVTERTADLTAANERLAAIDRSRRRFFADVSHELRTPLTVVLGECDIALRAPVITEEETRSILTTIRQRAQRLHRRVEDMLRVARSESGEISLDFKQVSLARVLEEAVESYTAVARRRHLRIELVRPVPDSDVVADGEWIRQVVEGLIDNAVRHAKGATVIRVALEDRLDSASILVVDDGSGIPEGAREQVFERFSRRSGNESSVFGLGLALARWVITRHGGSIDITSAESTAGGTRVEIVLPKAGDGSEGVGQPR